MFDWLSSRSGFAGSRVVLGLAILALPVVPGVLFAEDVPPADLAVDAPLVDASAQHADFSQIIRLSASPSGMSEELDAGAPPMPSITVAEPLAISNPPINPSVTSPRFELSQAERIRLRVWGNNDVSGSYTLNQDKSVSLPLIGRVQVGKLTTAEAEQLITRKISGLARSDVPVAIEVERYRPAFVLGQVVEAGAIEWRPGLKVMQAVALARGVMRPATATPVATSQAQLQSQRIFTMAQLARLKAERDESSAIDTDGRLTAMSGRLSAGDRLVLENLIVRQNDILREQREMTSAQNVGLQRQRETAQREVEAAEKQERAVREQVEITRAQLSDIEDLRNRQLVPKSRYLSQKSDLLSSEVRYTESHSLLERARARLSSAEQELDLVPRQRRAVLGERIDTLERDVAQLEIALGTSASDPDMNKLIYTISREEGGALNTIDATVFSEMLPGDVLIVARASDQTVAVDLRDGSTKLTDVESAQRMIEAAAVTVPSSSFGRSLPQTDH